MPDLLAKTLQKGWRAVVRCGGEERVEDLNRLLWVHADESFLPHGSAADGNAEKQPIYLTSGDETPNGAEALFLVDGAGADPAEMARFERCLLIFDGRDKAALQGARAAWKAAVEAGLDAVYWAEKEGGGWEKKAEKRASEASPS